MSRSAALLSMIVLLVTVTLPQHAEQVGRGEVVGVGDVGELDQVLAQRRQVVVDLAEVGVELVHGLAELLAAALERGGQRVERGVEVGRPHGAQQREQVGEDLAQLDVGLDPVGRDHVAVRRAASTTGRRGGRSEMNFWPNSVVGRISTVDVRRGSRSACVGLERDRDDRLLAVLADLADLADQRRR